MVLHNSRFIAQVSMLGRILLIGLFLFARLTGRLSGEESDPDAPARVPLPTLGGKQFWADELFFHGWHIQRHVSNEQCRLLDEDDFCHATGTFEHCREVLERIKKERRLPEMSGRAVVVLHGLIRSRGSMEPLCQYLRQKGGYMVFNVGYPSTQADIAAHARSLCSVIRHLDGIDEINFVGHSMGNIVIRHYLGDLARQESWKLAASQLAADRRAVARFGRFVMLGPPNQGALLAEVFSDNLLFKQICGESGLQLGRDWPELEKHLATPDFPFGIIAGGTGNSRGYNPLLPGDNDGTLTVESTKLAGAADFIILPALHSYMMDNKQVQQCVLRFLRNGRFQSRSKPTPAEARQ